MSRSIRPARLLAALCGIAAVALAAATLPSPLETGGEGGDFGTGGEGGERAPPGPMLEPGASDGVPPFLEYLGYLLVLLAAVAIAWYLIVHRREAVKWLAVGAVVLLVIFLIGELLPTVAEPEIVPIEEQPPGDDALPGEGDGEQTPVPVTPVVLVVAVVAAVFVIALLATRGGGSLPSPPGLRGARSTSSEADPDVAAVADAAGRAADRLEDSTADNDIYRAWREMTGLLTVERPAATTPREFAAAAVEAGMDPADVDELTRLFEDVRYGDTEPTAERNERAKTVFRRIESAYAETAAAGPGDAAGADEVADSGADGTTGSGADEPSGGDPA